MPSSPPFWKYMAISGQLLLRPSVTVGSFVGSHGGKTRASIFRRNMSSSASLTGKTYVSLQDALEAHKDPTVQFIDGSWFLGKARIARDEFEAGPRIARAHFFDIDDICAKGPQLNPKALPHMMPPKELFAATMDAMGITHENSLVIYGSKECGFTHRAWFQIRNMGHDPKKIHLMAASLDDWIEAGGPIQDGPAKALVSSHLDLAKPTAYQSTGPLNILDMNDMLHIIQQGDESDFIIVDARAQERYLGLVDEPRPGLRLGHMPGAKNVPFMSLLNPDNVSQLKPVEQLAAIFEEAGLDIHSPKKIVASCGSGATACTLLAAMEYMGRSPSDNYIYDGSWVEWGSELDTPIIPKMEDS